MNLDKPTKYYLPSPVTFNHNNGTWAKYYSDHYGRIIKVVNSNGAWMTKKWDENNLIQRVYSDGSWEEWEYNNGDLIKSKRKSASNNSEIKTFTYP